MVFALENLRDLIWGVPMLVLILGCGLYFSMGSGFVQLRWFPKASRAFVRQGFGKNESGDKSGFRALCTALSATVGTGNIAGVGGAICLGGPGAIFWMWVFAFFGMAVKFSEATLAVRYRRDGGKGIHYGGPMYMIEKGLGTRWKPLAVIYCLFGVFAALGVGNATQINTVSVGINGVLQSYGLAPGLVWNLFIGIGLACLIGAALQGGGVRIGEITENLIPIACGGYIILCLIAVILGKGSVIQAFGQIIQGAFHPSALTGGAFGSAFIALRVGASRGLLTNEAGMGTASMAHAGARVNHPVEQGFMGIIEVFLDTIVICTLTALVILVSGVKIPYGYDGGLSLTSAAFSAILGQWVRIPITVFLCLFAIATVLGWGLYGAMCIRYLLGDGAIVWFYRLQIVVIFVSTILETSTVWVLTEIVNGLMAIPNLVVLIGLSPELFALVSDYGKRLRRNAGGVRVREAV